MSTYLKRESFYVLKVFIDGLLFAASYMALYYIKRRNLYFEGDYWHLFLVMMGLWFLATVFSRKFKRVAEDDYFRQTRPFLVSIVALTAMVSLAVYLLGWYHLSRFVVYGTIALFLVLENLYLTARNVRLWRIGAIETIPFSVVFFLLELLAIAATFTAVYLFRKGTVKMPEDYLVLLMGIFFIWFVSSLLIHKFDVRMDDKFLNVVFPFWKSEVIIVGLTAYFIVVLNLAAFSRFGFVNGAKERDALGEYIRRLGIKVPHQEQLAKNLSGGNQQKVVLAKWLQRNCEAIIFDEPTRGIDVGTKYEIYLLMNELAADGKAIVMISSELPEVLGMSDRILVMHEGRITGEITDVESATQEQILEMAIG